jgi:hypothetical protein
MLSRSLALSLSLILVSGCSGELQEVTGSAPTSDVRITVLSPGGQRVELVYEGDPAAEVGFVGDIVGFAERAVQASGSIASITVVTAEHQIRVASSKAESTSSLCPLLFVYPQMVASEARLRGFEQTSFTSRGLDNLRPTCVTEYKATLCEAGPGVGTSTGCAAVWTCDNGASGCVYIGAGHCSN